MTPRLIQRFLYLAGTAILVVCVGPAATADSHGRTDFNEVIQPILADNCFFCHGPDKQESSLRLDRRDVAVAQGVIGNGQPGTSELVSRITSNDPKERMPPPDSNRSLRPEEIKALTEWVEEGAPYEKHWAWQSVPQAEISLEKRGRLSDWVRNPIDAMVYKQMRSEGREPTPPATPERLLRRLHFDLTGLPPSIDSMDAFLRDSSPRAYERVVDRILTSPRFGEHWARAWLDMSRYADTFGYDNDREMHVWPWRDWVIQAFNQNLSYDRFLRYQIAGDLLPDATTNQRLATTFNRLHRQNAEGGVLPDEFLIEYVADRTQTFATAFMGVTLECARCHDHKFDPISQKDYYALTAYFNNIDEAGVYAEKTGAIPTPNMFLYAPGQKQRHDELRQGIEIKSKKLEEVEAEASVRFVQWREKQSVEAMAVTPPLVQFDFESMDELPSSARRVASKMGWGIEFAGDEGVTIKELGSFERTDSFSIAIWLKLGKALDRRVICHNSKPNWEAGSRGFELILDERRVEFGLSHFWPGNAIRVRSRDPVPAGTWHHLVVTYNGSSNASGLSVFVDGKAVEIEILKDHLYSSIRFPGKAPPTILGARLSELGLKGDGVDEFQLFNVCLSPVEIGRLAGMERAPTDADLLAHYIVRIDPPYRDAFQALQRARMEENKFVSSLRSIMVMDERSQLPEARVLFRGAYNAAGERVSPGVPQSIFSSESHKGNDRLALSDWLLDRNHPLTSRVAVNRIWANFFGRGLVESMGDFGVQGSRPSHPALLDHLAKTLMDLGWDIKAFCRLIVTSATYRQRGYGESPEALAGSLRHRLSAEQIRDGALAASGMLSLRIGGPSVKPVQPAGLWAETGPQKYQPDTGEDLYRRSLYTFWKRTAPPPNLLTFDGVSRELCVSKRETTQTPLQSLLLLNDVQFLESARVLAEDIMMQASVDSDIVVEVFRRLVSRFPSKEEQRELQSYLEEQRDWFTRFPDAAEQYVEVGHWPRSASQNTIQTAALMALVQLVMNFHDFQMK